ncbi:alpha-L-fucosidase [Aureibaculum sp. 2210JD6-5]|uniref:alpha-L-fucosidase n=1 Tax=Aureibaculum sp. 2210JD6-5 TaxID=3103957 RepID=UPI002AAEA472|nr:alpha-L-fucosidase [Aureibaculum sp. 2210JD6-5]MDY7395399.1 alpha-L-fucosidase [Aureibaculum sp. 2210JD6-5]
MKNIFLIVLILFGLQSWSQNTEKQLNKVQLEQIERGYGMFIHFGINTFNETEWSDGTLPVSSYNPTALDCDQWIKIAKEAGFRYVILVTKHHDGFSLWDSKFTDYDVASSPVKTDIVGEVAKACKKYGLKLGLYYSLWDRHEPSYSNMKKYGKYMKNQLTELMTNYGDICELWFDGGWDKKDEEWNLPYIYQYVKKMQPNCLITVNHTIGKPENRSKIRQPVNYQYGDPIRYFPVDFRIKDPNLARWDDPKFYEYNGKMYRLPFEHTLCLSDRWNWFQKSKVLAARPLDELEELFYWCTSNNNIMILNVPPDTEGKIKTHEKVRILELADRLGIRGGENPLPSGYSNMTFNKKIEATSWKGTNTANKANDYSLETFWTAKDTVATLTIDFEEKITFDRISIFENAKMKDLGDFFSKIRIFSVTEYELQNFDKGKWETFYVGDKLGACKIIDLPMQMEAEKIRLKIVNGTDIPSISHFAVSKKSTKGLRTFKN